jgi:hypothetical protein
MTRDYAPTEFLSKSKEKPCLRHWLADLSLDLASETAVTLVGRRSINRASHGRLCVPCLREYSD